MLAFLNVSEMTSRPSVPTPLGRSTKAIEAGDPFVLSHLGHGSSPRLFESLGSPFVTKLTR